MARETHGTVRGGISILGRTRCRAVRVCAREATLFFATVPAVAVYPEGVTGWGAQISPVMVAEGRAKAFSWSCRRNAEPLRAVLSFFFEDPSTISLGGGSTPPA